MNKLGQHHHRRPRSNNIKSHRHRPAAGEQATTPRRPSTPRQPSATPPAAGVATVPSENGAGTAILVGTGVVAAGGAGAYLYFRNRRKKAAQASSASYGPQGAELDPLASLSVEELRRKSGSLLIEADDAIKSSEQELMFAQAQYGDSAVGNFTKALQEAKGHMSESFKLQQQLDDHIPDTEEQQRSWLGEIIRRSEAALGLPAGTEGRLRFTARAGEERAAGTRRRQCRGTGSRREDRQRRTVADHPPRQIRGQRPGPGHRQHHAGQGAAGLRPERHGYCRAEAG